MLYHLATPASVPLHLSVIVSITPDMAIKLVNFQKLRRKIPQADASIPKGYYIGLSFLSKYTSR
jgi:hypothetical protein